MPKTKKVKTKKVKKATKPKVIKTKKTPKAPKVKKPKSAVAETVVVPVVEPVPETVEAPVVPAEPTPPSAAALASIPGEEPKTVKPKKVKKAKVIAQTTFHFDPPHTDWTRPIVDEGWRNYRIWTNYELDWDDKDDDAGKMASIKSCMGKSKASLVKALEAMPSESLIVKTDLKLDEFPFEPFIEIWVSCEKEAELIAKLIELPVISTIDPDSDIEVKTIEKAIAVETPVKEVKAKKTKKVKKADKQEEATT